MSQTVYTLAAGEKTPWMDLRPINGGGFTFQGLLASDAIAAIETCNADPSSPTDTPDDVVTVASYTGATFAKSAYGPMPRYVRVKNSSATGTVTVTFGGCHDAKGHPGVVQAVGFQYGTSGRSNDMPS